MPWNIEFQMSAPSFLAVQRNALRSLGICPPPLPPSGGVQLVIDRIDIGNNTLRHNVESEFYVYYMDAYAGPQQTKNRCMGYKTQLAQDVVLQVTTQAEILSHPNGTPRLAAVPLRLVFSLGFIAIDGECYIGAHFDTVETPAPPGFPPFFSPRKAFTDDEWKAIVDYLRQQLAPYTSRSPGIPVGLAQLKFLPKFLNAGVSVDSQGQCVAFRISFDIQNQSADSPWSNFFKGVFPVLLHEAALKPPADWGFFVDADILTTTIQTLVYEQLPKDDSLQAYPGCTYSVEDGKPVLTIDVLLIDHLYRNHDVDLDIRAEADPKVPIQLAVERADQLTLRFDFTHLLDSDDPLVNLAHELADFLGLGLEDLLYQMVGGIAVAQLSSADNVCKQTTPGHVECVYHIRMPQGAPLQTMATALVPGVDHFGILGTKRVEELTAAVVQTTVHDFRIGAPHTSCGAASMALAALFMQDPSGFAVLHANAIIENAGSAPLNLCSIAVLTGAGGPFPPRNVRTDGTQATFQIMIDIAAPPPPYYANPFPLDLLVTTSGGTRLLRFAPPPVITKHDYDRMAAELLIQIGNCEQLVDPWFFNHKGYNPGWSPRPPGDARVEHLWQVEVDGLPAGGEAALVDSRDRELAHAVSAGGRVQLSALVEPGAEHELTIMHVGGVMLRATPTLPAQTGAVSRGLTVRQTNLVYRGSVPLSARCSSLAVVSRMGEPCVLAVLDGYVAALDFVRDDRLRQIRSWRIDGVRGALAWQGGLLAFGEEGFTWLERLERNNGRDLPCETITVADAAADARVLYALSDNGVAVYSRRLCRIGELPLEGGTSLLRVSKKLIVGGKRGLAVFDVSNPRRPERHATVGNVHIAALAFTPPGETGTFVAMGADESARVFRLNGEQVVEMSHSRRVPWFARTVRVGETLVRIGKDHRNLEMFRFGASAIQ